jgi:hypothetical protein
MIKLAEPSLKEERKVKRVLTMRRDLLGYLVASLVRPLNVLRVVVVVL